LVEVFSDRGRIYGKIAGLASEELKTVFREVRRLARALANSFSARQVVQFGVFCTNPKRRRGPNYCSRLRFGLPRIRQESRKSSNWTITFRDSTSPKGREL
jgi:hypothetical protein